MMSEPRVDEDLGGWSRIRLDRRGQHLWTRVDHQTAAVGFFALGVYVVVTAPVLGLWGALGPGPGLFPFLLSLMMMPLAVAWFLRVTFSGLRADEDVPFFADRPGAIRVGILVGGLICLGLLLPLLGYQLTAFVLVLLFLAIEWPHHWIASLIIAVAGSFGLYHLFVNLLHVRLPTSGLAFLAGIGL